MGCTKLLVSWVPSSYQFAFQDLQQLVDVHLAGVIAGVSPHQQCRWFTRRRSSERSGQNLIVESVISGLILVYLDCQMEPGFWVSVGWPSNGHVSKRHRDSMVKSSTELDYNGLQVRVLGIAYEVPELIQVGIGRSVTLEVVCHLEHQENRTNII